MRLSERFPVPPELALLYEFVNSLDVRRYVEKGVPHRPEDELSTVDRLEGWLSARGLLAKGGALDADDHRRALELRDALRSFVQLEPAQRPADAPAAIRMNAVSAGFPLSVVFPAERGVLALRPMAGANGLGQALAELYRLAQLGLLDRLKMCASDQCGWVFYDRSKPGNRRWCSSARCGNREKTRGYRLRHRGRAGPDASGA